MTPFYRPLRECFLLLTITSSLLHCGCHGNQSIPPAVSRASAEASSTAPTEASRKTIKLVIDFGDGYQRVYLALNWTDQTTVLAVLQQAQQHPHPLTFTFTGSGETAFITSIEGVANEGSGTEKKNWLFWVNGKFGDRSAGVVTCPAGAELVWKFTTWPKS